MATCCERIVTPRSRSKPPKLLSRPAQKADLDSAATALATGATAPGRQAEAAARRALDDCDHARRAAAIAVERAAADVESIVAANRPALLARNDERLTAVHDDIAAHTARLRQLVVERSQLLAQRDWVYDPTRTIRAGVTSVPTPFGNQRPIAKLLDDIDKAMTPPVDPVPRFAAALVLTPDVDGGDAA